MKQHNSLVRLLLSALVLGSLVGSLTASQVASAQTASSTSATAKKPVKKTTKKTSKKASKKTASRQDDQLGTSFRFGADSLHGRYRNSMITTATVENDKYLDDLLSPPKNFNSRVQAEAQKN